jgi:3-hydroxymyristoyl/3-hydroxydecanoyl-(acyl carrier protein) dehydratase
VAEDLLVAAGQATVDRGARVDGDLIFAAGRMQVDGAVAGSVLGSTGNYARGGSVGGSERVNVGQREEEQVPTLADRTVEALRRYVSILVIGVLLLWLLPRLVRRAADAARGRPLASFGVGILGFIGVIVALVLLLFVTVLVAVVLGLLGLGSLTGVTVFGGLLAAAVIVFPFVLAVAFAAQATVGLALGRLLFRGDGRSFLGSLGALAARLLEEETGRQWRLAGAGAVGFRHFVQPGDQMEVTVELKERNDDSATLSGDVKVEGKLVTRARQLRMAPVG